MDSKFSVSNYLSVAQSRQPKMRSVLVEIHYLQNRMADLAFGKTIRMHTGMYRMSQWSDTIFNILGPSSSYALAVEMNTTNLMAKTQSDRWQANYRTIFEINCTH